MELIKARIALMVMLTAWCGACMATNGSVFRWTILSAVFGVGLASAGTAAANEIVERKSDAKMNRTRHRPLVTGIIAVPHAVIATAALTFGGTLLIGVASNWLAALLTLATAITYIAIYTPLKKVTPLCTAIGAIPGAMPILLGWVAVRGQVDWQSIALFAILVFWQFPHFHAIALLYADDYGRGGIRMLAVVDPDGRSTRLRIAAYSIALITATLLPVYLHMSSYIYGAAALLLGLPLLAQAVRMLRHPVKQEARRMLLATVAYLPLLMAALVLDRML